MQFAQYTEPEVGDRFVPKDNIGHVVVVKVDGIKTGVVTSNSPDGTSAVEAQVADLDGADENGVTPAVYRDTLLFGGSFVDGLKPFVGQMVVVRLEQRTSKSGRTYAVPVQVGEAETTRAAQAFAGGDLFAQPIGTAGETPQSGQPGGAPAGGKPPF